MRALIITSSRTALLEKILFSVVGFSEDQITWADPDKPFSMRGDKPDVIVPLGQKSLDKLGLVELTSITKDAGKVGEYLGVPVVPIMAPGFIEKNEHLLRKWADDFYTAYAIMAGITKLDQTNQEVIVTNAIQLMDLIDNIKRSGYCSFDFETTTLTDLKTHDPNFYCTTISLSFQQGSSYVIPLYHKDSPNSKEFIETCRAELEKEVFLNPDVTKIGQNVKFDMHCLTWWGILLVLGPIHDTMVMHHLLDEHSRHGLKLLVSIYHPRYTDYDKALGDFNKDYAAIPLEALCTYNAMDSDLTLRLYWQFTELLLKEDERLYILFRNLIAPATPALFAMEQRGMLINKEYLLDSIEKVKAIIAEVEGEMSDIPQVKEFEKYREDKALLEYVTDLSNKRAARKDKLLAAKEKKCQSFDDRIAKTKGKIGTFKSEKAEQNNQTKILEFTEQLDIMDASAIVDDQLDKWEAIINSWEDYSIVTLDHLKPEDYELNLSSPAQITELLYGRNGFKFFIPDDQYGRPLKNSSKNTLELIKDKSGFLDNLLAHRQLKKILGTYLESILVRMDENHCIHGTFNQNGTGTGRLSSSDPNLQNIIKRTKYKKVEEAVAMVMKCFIPPKGMNIMQADYSQAELRLMAYYSKDPVMLEAYANGEDLHMLTAATTMGMSLAKFKKEPEKEIKLRRYEAKSTNFGFIYKITPEGFMEYCRTTYGINISLKQARERQKSFFKKYAKIEDYHADSVAKAKKFGYVRTLFGQKIRLPDIYSTDQYKQGHAERNAINGRIQGTAGQMMIFAIALLYQRARWLLLANTVHDSAVPYVAPGPQREIAILKETMENLPMKEYFDVEVDTVAMAVDFEISKSSWGELEEF